MEEFRAPELADRQWVVSLLAAEGSFACEYNFDNIYLWSRAYAQRIARHEDRLLVEIQGSLGVCYLFPVGSGALAPALDTLRACAAAHGNPLTLVCVTREQREALEQTCPGRFVYEEDRSGWDYVYDVNRLASLAGKKLHAKRNHIHRFDEQFPDWLFQPVSPENVPECVALEWEWAARRREMVGEDEELSEETAAVIEALYQMEALELEGGLIRAGGKVVAFSLGSFTTPDCFNVHFEKALAHMQGSYAAINRELARLIRDRHPGVRWFNREDDLGLEGLRKAKLSYYPDLFVEKYTACER